MERSIDHHQHIPAKEAISAAEKVITLPRWLANFGSQKSTLVVSVT
jgi:hypothetical protein